MIAALVYRAVVEVAMAEYAATRAYWPGRGRVNARFHNINVNVTSVSM